MHLSCSPHHSLSIKTGSWFNPSPFLHSRSSQSACLSSSLFLEYLSLFSLFEQDMHSHAVLFASFPLNQDWQLVQSLNPLFFTVSILSSSLSNLADLIIPCLFSLLHSSHLLLDLSFSLLGENVVVAVGERREMASRISSHGQCVLPEHRSV